MQLRNFFEVVFIQLCTLNGCRKKRKCFSTNLKQCAVNPNGSVTGWMNCAKKFPIPKDDSSYFWKTQATESFWSDNFCFLPQSHFWVLFLHNSTGSRSDWMNDFSIVYNKIKKKFLLGPFHLLFNSKQFAIYLWNDFIYFFFFGFFFVLFDYVHFLFWQIAFNLYTKAKYE